MKFDLDLPQSSGCRIEVAVGRDADGDGCLSDDESKLAVEWSRNASAVRGVDGEVKASFDSAPHGSRMSLVLKPGRREAPPLCGSCRIPVLRRFASVRSIRVSGFPT